MKRRPNKPNSITREQLLTLDKPLHGGSYGNPVTVRHNDQLREFRNSITRLAPDFVRSRCSSGPLPL